mgnify:CR=1 FL=1
MAREDAAHNTAQWPEELRYRSGERVLHVSFDDGSAFDLPAEYLRVESPSAELKGHGQGPPMIPGGKKNVAIKDIQPVGSYAVRLIFDDGHETGLYTWGLLHQLGTEFDTRWAAYVQALAEKGLSREG